MNENFKIGDFVKLKNYLEINIRKDTFYKIIDIDDYQFLELEGIDGRVFNPILFKKDIVGLRKEKLKKINKYYERLNKII